MRAASIIDTTRTLIYRCAKLLRIFYNTKLFVRFLTQSTQKGRFRCVLKVLHPISRQDDFE